MKMQPKDFKYAEANLLSWVVSIFSNKLITNLYIIFKCINFSIQSNLRGHYMLRFIRFA